MSLWNHRLDQNTNENFDSFCPGPFRAEIINFFVGILVQTMTSLRHFEINWPLAVLRFDWPNFQKAGKLEMAWLYFPCIYLIINSTHFSNIWNDSRLIDLYLQNSKVCGYCVKYGRPTTFVSMKSCDITDRPDPCGNPNTGKVKPNKFRLANCTCT